jgi:hypothetical protein
MMKEFIRYYLGFFVKDGYLYEKLRQFYFFWALRFARNCAGEGVVGVWVRRSLTTKDFVPFWSDIDLTVVIQEESFHKISLNPDLLVQDIQIISDKHLHSWLRTGGVRNRQINHWIRLIGRLELHLPPQENDGILAFELVHEFYLLYHQLEKKLHHQTSSSWQKESTWKLLAEMKRITLFWKTKDLQVLSTLRADLLPRENVDPANLREVFLSLDQCWGEILGHLQSPLGEFDVAELIISETPDHHLLNLTIQDKPVVIAKDAGKIPGLMEQFPESFLCTYNFVKMIKGAGVQEQTLLNQLARDRKSYYFDFNLQRLAHDLLGCFFLSPNQLTQLYYCYKNIHDFYLALTGQECFYWKEIEDRWAKGIIYHNHQELTQFTARFLEELNSLR